MIRCRLLACLSLILFLGMLLSFFIFSFYLTSASQLKYPSQEPTRLFTNTSGILEFPDGRVNILQTLLYTRPAVVVLLYNHRYVSIPMFIQLILFLVATHYFFNNKYDVSTFWSSSERVSTNISAKIQLPKF